MPEIIVKGIVVFQFIVIAYLLIRVWVYKNVAKSLVIFMEAKGINLAMSEKAIFEIFNKVRKGN